MSDENLLFRGVAGKQYVSAATSQDSVTICVHLIKVGSDVSRRIHGKRVILIEVHGILNTVTPFAEVQPILGVKVKPVNGSRRPSLRGDLEAKVRSKFGRVAPIPAC